VQTRDLAAFNHVCPLTISSMPMRVTSSRSFFPPSRLLSKE